MCGSVTFAVVADLHMDIMHDGAWRIQTFLDAARRARVDFIISLGDFLYPVRPVQTACPPEKLPVNLRLALQQSTPPRLDVLAAFNAFEKPVFHVMGNHEMDFCTKAEVLQAYGMPNNYYAWHLNGWHFIVLDSSFYRGADGGIKDYNWGEYFATDDLPYLSQAQLEWLQQELCTGDEPTVLFSHQPLYRCPRGLKNVDTFRQILRRANRDRKKVKLCLNGHLHVDDLHIEDEVLYYTVNSISNLWMGPAYAARHYPAEIERQYPNLQFVAPYGTPLFAIVHLDEKGVRVEGRQGEFVPPTPAQLGWQGKASPAIQSWRRCWQP